VRLLPNTFVLSSGIMADEKRDVNTGGTPTVEDMRCAIENSGYLLEGRIARVMTEHGFLVQPNGFYTIPGSEKAVEVDAEGRASEWVNEANRDTVTALLLVECKNNSQPFAFFTHEQQSPVINAERIRYGGYPSFSTDQETKVQVPLHELLEMKDWHHYARSLEVATQFCSFSRANEKKEWKAEPMEHYAKSFSSLATVAASTQGEIFDLRASNIQVQLSYPIVVYQGPLYQVRDDGGRATLEATEHVQLHHSAHLNGGVVSVQIDAVTEREFPRLAARILEELKTFRDRVNGLYPRLLNSALDQKRVASQNAARRDFQRWERVPDFR
jgi:hypothetical protein